jgi:hypothetical protein
MGIAGVDEGSSGLCASVGDSSDTAIERRSAKVTGFDSCLGLVGVGSSLIDASVGSSAFRVSMSAAPVPGREPTGTVPASSGLPLNSWNSVAPGPEGISSPFHLRCRFRRTKKTTAATPTRTRNAARTEAAMIAVRLMPEPLVDESLSLSLLLSELPPSPPLPGLLVADTDDDRLSV